MADTFENNAGMELKLASATKPNQWIRFFYNAFSLFTCTKILQFRNEKGTGTPELFLGWFLGKAPVSYWPIFFFLSPVTVPEVFAKVNSVQFPSRFWREDLR